MSTQSSLDTAALPHSKRQRKTLQGLGICAARMDLDDDDLLFHTRAKKQLHAQSQPQQSKESTRKAPVSSDEDIEKQHLSTPLYDEVDVFDEPLEHQQIIPY